MKKKSGYFNQKSINMKIPRTFREWWMCLIGFPYLLNINSMEVHDLRKKTKNCWINLMTPKNKLYLSEKQFQDTLKNGHKGKPVNGCRWCLKKHNTG